MACPEGVSWDSTRQGLCPWGSAAGALAWQRSCSSESCQCCAPASRTTASPPPGGRTGCLVSNATRKLGYVSHASSVPDRSSILSSPVTEGPNRVTVQGASVTRCTSIPVEIGGWHCPAMLDPQTAHHHTSRVLCTRQSRKTESCSEEAGELRGPVSLIALWRRVYTLDRHAARRELEYTWHRWIAYAHTILPHSSSRAACKQASGL